MRLEEFIKTKIESLDDLRALLLFKSSPEKPMDASEVAGKLYLPPAKAAAVLTRLTAKGLVAYDSGQKHYYYQPDSAETERLIGELVELDRRRPVSLINMIYTPAGDIKAFADAFRIKKEKEN